MAPTRRRGVRAAAVGCVAVAVVALLTMPASSAVPTAEVGGGWTPFEVLDDAGRRESLTNQTTGAGTSVIDWAGSVLSADDERVWASVRRPLDTHGLTASCSGATSSTTT